MKSPLLSKLVAGGLAAAAVTVAAVVTPTGAAEAANRVAYGPFSSSSACYAEKAKYFSSSWSNVSKYCYLRQYNDWNGNVHKDYYFYVTYRTH